MMQLSDQAELDVDCDQIDNLLAALGTPGGASGNAVEGDLEGIRVRVRNAAFPGKRGGRVVRLQGTQQELAVVTARILTELCHTMEPRHWADTVDEPVWAYPDPVQQDKIHGPYSFQKVLQWRQSGPFTDSLLLKQVEAKCWLPLWLAVAVHSLPPPSNGMQHEHENYADPPMQDWDGDEIMEDLEGLQLDDMTKQLASFRQPGQTLYQYTSSLAGEGQSTSVQLPDAMDYVPEGQRHMTVVIDTNVLVEKLTLLAQVCDIFRALAKDHSNNITAHVLVPSIVLAELDGLKRAPVAAPGSVAQRSRQALRWLEKAQQGSDSVIRGQSARDRKKAAEAYRSTGSDVANDDLVLFCALFLRDQKDERAGQLATVHVLTDDRNLRIKAQSEELSALSFEDAPCSVQQAMNLCLGDVRPTPSARNGHSDGPQQLGLSRSNSVTGSHVDPMHVDQPDRSTQQDRMPQPAVTHADAARSGLPRLQTRRSSGSNQDGYASSPLARQSPAAAGRLSPMAGAQPGNLDSIVRQVVESALVAQMLWKLQEDEWWIKEPSSIVSNPLPWTADVAVAVLVSVWGTFQELAGPQKMQAERDAKALRRMLKPNRVASNKEAIEAGHLLLSILQALGPPEPRRTSEIQPSSNVSIKGSVSWEEARQLSLAGCSILRQLLSNESSSPAAAAQSSRLQIDRRVPVQNSRSFLTHGAGPLNQRPLPPEQLAGMSASATEANAAAGTAQHAFRGPPGIHAGSPSTHYHSASAAFFDQQSSLGHSRLQHDSQRLASQSTWPHSSNAARPAGLHGSHSGPPYPAGHDARQAALLAQDLAPLALDRDSPARVHAAAGGVFLPAASSSPHPSAAHIHANPQHLPADISGQSAQPSSASINSPGILLQGMLDKSIETLGRAMSLAQTNPQIASNLEQQCQRLKATLQEGLQTALSMSSAPSQDLAWQRLIICTNSLWFELNRLLQVTQEGGCPNDWIQVCVLTFNDKLAADILKQKLFILHKLAHDFGILVAPSAEIAAPDMAGPAHAP